MNITAKQYAESLYLSIQDKKEKEIKEIVGKFAGILNVNNDLAKEKKIITLFIKIWNHENKIIDVEAISAKEMDKSILKSLGEYIQKNTGASSVNLSEKTEKNLLGGVILKYGDKIIDMSLKSRLRMLGEAMNK